MPFSWYPLFESATAPRPRKDRRLAVVAFVCSECTGRQGEQIWRADSLRRSALGLCSVLSKWSHTEINCRRHIVPSNSSNQGQVVLVFHSQALLKIHREPPVSPHLSASEQLCVMAYDIRRGALRVFCVLSRTHPTKQDRSTEWCIGSLSARLHSWPRHAHQDTKYTLTHCSPLCEWRKNSKSLRY